MADEYLKSLKIDSDLSKAYYRKSIEKTRQQIFLESLLLKEPAISGRIADVACGGGTLSYHLNQIFPKAKFSLIDYNPEALTIAKELNSTENFSFYEDSIYELRMDTGIFDAVFCWQTLSWLNHPEKALDELVRICKTGSKIYLSSLFNRDFDVDLYTKVFDHTRKSSGENIAMNYNTYSLYSVQRWLSGKISDFSFHEFKIDLELEYSGRGMGTFTKRCGDDLLQISGGMLMNWGILVITK